LALPSHFGGALQAVRNFTPPHVCAPKRAAVPSVPPDPSSAGGKVGAVLQ
jgi:hypothetical protein